MTERMQIHEVRVRRDNKDVVVWLKTCAATDAPWLIFKLSVCNETYADLLTQYLSKGVRDALENLQREAYLAGYRHGAHHKKKEDTFYGDLDADFWRQLK